MGIEPAVKIEIDDSQAGRIERGIAPPMRMVSTLPVTVGKRRFTVYVCQGAFDMADIPAAELAAVARTIAAAVKRHNSVDAASAPDQESPLANGEAPHAT